MTTQFAMKKLQGILNDKRKNKDQNTEAYNFSQDEFQLLQGIADEGIKVSKQVDQNINTVLKSIKDKQTTNHKS